MRQELHTQREISAKLRAEVSEGGDCGALRLDAGGGGASAAAAAAADDDDAAADAAAAAALPF